MMNAALSGAALGARLPAIRASKTRGRREGSASPIQTRISALEPAHHGRVTESTPPPPPHVEKTVRVGVARVPSDIYAANKVAPDIAAVSRLGAGEISEPRLLLRRALPFVLPDSHPLARVEDSLMEHAGEVKTRGMGWRAISNEALVESLEAQAAPGRAQRASLTARRAVATIRSERDALVSFAVAAGNGAVADDIVAELDDVLQSIVDRSEATTTAETTERQSEKKLELDFERALLLVARLQACGADAPAFPVPPRDSPVPGAPPGVVIPRDAMPLNRRAWVDLTVRKAKTGEKIVVRVAVDGFNAPYAAGRFMQLAETNGFKRIDRADGFIVAFGEDVGTPRHPSASTPLPLEVKLADDGKSEPPLYGVSVDDAGARNARVELPFNAYGTLAMSHSADDVNDGATQFFFLTKESEVTPSGTNVLDGRWSVVGYAVDGAEGLADLNAGDVIESVREVR